MMLLILVTAGVLAAIALVVGIGALLLRAKLRSVDDKSRTYDPDFERLRALTYPPPYPNGWFAVCSSADVGPGEVMEVEAFGQRLAVFRGDDGAVGVVDAFCPHLGANLSDRCVCAGLVSQRPRASVVDHKRGPSQSGEQPVPRHDRAYATHPPSGLRRERGRLRPLRVRPQDPQHPLRQSAGDHSAHILAFEFTTNVGNPILVKTFTPVGELKVRMVDHLFAPKGTRSILARLVAAEATAQFVDDIKIWERKRYQETPALVAGDGPIMQLRAWYSQFYTESSYANRPADKTVDRPESPVQSS